MDEFKRKIKGIAECFEWSISRKKDLGEDTEIEEKCLEDCETTLKLIKMFEMGLLQSHIFF